MSECQTASVDAEQLTRNTQELEAELVRIATALEEARIALGDIEKRIASTTDPAERVRIEAHIALVESIVAKLERM